MIKLNGEVVKFGHFPNGEVYLDKRELLIRADNCITWEYYNNSEIFNLALLTYQLKREYRIYMIHVIYFPYSRMDRENTNYVFSLKVLANMLNTMGFYAIKIREPHSDVTPALFDNAHVENFIQARYKKVAEKCGADTILLPDAGAAKRYKIEGYNVLVGNKRRDFETGHIISYDIDGEPGKTVLILDDMCSRGGTFIYATNELKAKGAENVYLFVSYCEHTVFTGELFDYVERLYTGSTNLTPHEQIEVVEC